MTEKELENDFHTKFAKKCFNEAWNYLDKQEKTLDDKIQLLMLVNASAYHWTFVGKPKNFMISYWQISRAYADIGEGNLAVIYAEKAMDLFNEHKPDLTMTCTFYECLARAHGSNNNTSEARKNINLAKDNLKLVSDEEDKDLYLSQINDTIKLFNL